MINEEESYSIMDIKEADPQLEKHRKEVIDKKYREFHKEAWEKKLSKKVTKKDMDEVIDKMKKLEKLIDEFLFKKIN